MRLLTSDDLQRQKEWSLKTFGPGPRTHGLIDHITKELDEVLADPTDINEWIDIMILAVDGAWRAGHTAPEIIQAYKDKMKVNYARNWPNWEDFTDREAIEHVR